MRVDSPGAEKPHFLRSFEEERGRKERTCRAITRKEGELIFPCRGRRAVERRKIALPLAKDRSSSMNMEEGGKEISKTKKKYSSQVQGKRRGKVLLSGISLIKKG